MAAARDDDSIWSAYEEGPFHPRNIRRVWSKFELFGDVIQSLLLRAPGQSLQPHQVKCVDHIVNIFTGLQGKSPSLAVAVLPTEADKSVVAVLAAYVLKPRRVLVVASSEIGMQQFCVAFGCANRTDESVLVSQGFLPRDMPPFDVLHGADLVSDISQFPVALCTHELVMTHAYPFGQQAALRLESFDQDHFNLIIFEEAQTFSFPAPMWDRIIRHFTPHAKCLFLTPSLFPYPYANFLYIPGSNVCCVPMTAEEAVCMLASDGTSIVHDLGRLSLHSH